MKQIIKDEINSLPKGLWIAAAIVPFGIVTVAVYFAGKTMYNKITKK